MNRYGCLLATACLVVLFVGCAETLTPDTTGEEQADWMDEYGLEGPFDPAAPLGKPDMVSGPRISWESTDTVWDIQHQWADVTNEAGLAWDANSGLNWEQKYRAWMASLETIDRVPSGTSFQITTPYGVTLPAPILECAEVAIFMRATFASWYGLPFYLRASDGGRPIYLGHFGFRKSDGSRYSNTPNFRSRYRDYTVEWNGEGTFPSDSGLHSRGLYGGGDEVPFLPEVNGEPARAGAYFDALFLNKRAGHFMLMVLSWFGSMHLADNSNMMHLAPEATQPGDVLLERWQRRGIGHTIPVFRVVEPMEGRLDIAVATGSMPRRQPKWEDGADSRWYFINQYTGGPGENGDGDRYAVLGGGIRRWRTPTPSGSTYRAGPVTGEENLIISPSDLETIAARPARYEEILQEVTPEAMREAALGRINAARAHLADHPSSCSARERREEGFEALYTVMAEEFSTAKAQVDAQYRVLADYVFAKLVYNQSRSCCWNSTTRGMYEIIMDYAESEQRAAEQAGECVAPSVFMGRNNGNGGDGFQIYQAHGETLGRADDWVPWSADESCPQANNSTDVEAEHHWTAFCELPAVEDPPVPESCEDGNDFTSSATPIDATTLNGSICNETEVDYYSFTADSSQVVVVTVAFRHSDGDLDVVVESAASTRLGTGQSTDDNETVQVSVTPGTYYVKVHGYNGATADYTISLSREASSGQGCGDTGSTLETATAIDGARTGLQICPGESDWWVYTATQSGSTTVTISFQHSVGDLDMTLYGADGTAMNTSQGTADTESITFDAAADGDVFIKIYGYSGASGSYDLAIGR